MEFQRVEGKKYWKIQGGCEGFDGIPGSGRKKHREYVSQHISIK